MLEFSFGAAVRGTPERVFATIAHLESLPDHIRDIDEIELLTNGPVGQGTRFYHRRRLIGFKVRRPVTIVEWNPPARFVARFRVVGIDVDSDHVIERRKDGCHFTLSLRSTPYGIRRLVGTTIWFLLLRAIRRGVRREVEDVQRRLHGA